MDKASKYMLRAVELALKAMGRTSPNPVVGAVIVKDGIIVGEGYHKKAGGHHAEVNAVNAVKLKYCNSDDLLKGSELYVTLEPCSTHGRTPPCTDLIIKSGIKKVFVGCLDPNPKHSGAAVGILKNSGVEVITGIEEKKCNEINEAFFFYITKKSPFIILKMAMTLDGKIATESGQSKWITGVEARSRVQKLRKWADAVMVGGETYRCDKPSLTVRGENNELLDGWKQPLKVVVSNSLCSNEEIKVISPKNIFEWEKILNNFAENNIMSILVEGGGELAGELIKHKLVNRVEFHIAPKLLTGRGSRPVTGGANPLNLADAYNMTNVTVEMLGSDIKISGLLN